MNQEMKNAPVASVSKSKVTAYVFIALVVGVGLGWLLFAPVPVVKEESDTATTTDSAMVSDKPLVLAGESSVVVDDQKPGSSVEIKDVKLVEAGWVAIHESVDGKPGRVLGARWFPAGESTGIVTLLRPTTDAGSYFAVLHSDSSTKEGRIFDSKVNVAMVDASDEPISFQFLATITPAVQ